MTRFATLAAAAATLNVGRTVLGAYTEFFFTNEASNWRCPSVGFDCIAPKICSYEKLLDKHYCCGPGGVCWSGKTRCSGGSKGEPGQGQIGCSSGRNAFCCLDEREECTQRLNQINICWATPENPIKNISEERLNATFSSLSSASPTATSLPFDMASFISTETTTPTPSSTLGSSSIQTDDASSQASSSASESSSSIPNPDAESSNIESNNDGDDDTSVSGGTIGGIVAGVVAGLAVAGAGLFLTLRRRRNSKLQHAELDSNSYMPRHQQQPQEKYAQEAASEVPSPSPPQELPVTGFPVEMEGSKPQQTSQLPQN